MMNSSTVVSVNAGAPRTVVWRGREITTSIFKSPVAGPVAVHGINVEGDDQADREVHGGPDMAAYAYAAEDYAWWDGELGTTLGPGTFGENLTLAGVDVSGALVGERWRIGTALFEVASPRTPCYKLAMRMDDPAFVKRFAEALRPGAYLRIIEEGALRAGDDVVVTHRPSGSLSIARFAHIYLHDRGALHELLEVESIPQSWRDFATQQLERSS